MADDAPRSEHYATQAVLGAAVRLVAALDEPTDPERRNAEAGLREAVRLWQAAVGGQVVVTEPPAHAVTVRPGDTLVVAFTERHAYDFPEVRIADQLAEMRSALAGVDVVLFGGTIHGRFRPDAPPGAETGPSDG